MAIEMDFLALLPKTITNIGKDGPPQNLYPFIRHHLSSNFADKYKRNFSQERRNHKYLEQKRENTKQKLLKENSFSDINLR